MNDDVETIEITPNVSLLPFDFRIVKAKVARTGYNHRTLTVEARVRDRETGDFIFIKQDQVLSDISTTPIAVLIRDVLESFLMHELDELFLVDGDRTRNPHRGTHR